MLLTITIVFILLLFFAAIMASGLLSSRRSQQLRLQCHKQQPLNWCYRPYAQLSAGIKAAHFLILNASDSRLFRHLLEGQWPLQPSPAGDTEKMALTGFNLLDCSTITQQQTCTQTLLMMPLQRPLPAGLHCVISAAGSIHGDWPNDAFDTLSNLTLAPLADHQIPAALSERTITSTNPGQCAALIRETTLTHWLLTYPHLHIEFSNDILLAYKQNSIIDAEQIESALIIVAELNRILANNNKTMDS